MNKLSYLEENVTPVLSAEAIHDAVVLFNKKHQAFLEAEAFSIEAGKSRTQVQMKITLTKNDGSVAYPIEAVHVVDPESKDSALHVVGLMLDYLDSYWSEYLTSDRDVLLPIDWSAHSHEGLEFFLRGFVRQLSLEAQADALFREHGMGAYDIEPISSES